MLRPNHRLRKALNGSGHRDCVMCPAGADERRVKWIRLRAYLHNGSLIRMIGFNAWPKQRRWKPYVHKERGISEPFDKQ